MATLGFTGYLETGLVLLKKSVPQLSDVNLAAECDSVHNWVQTTWAVVTTGAKFYRIELSLQ